MEINSCLGCGSAKFKTIGGIGVAFDTSIENYIFSQPEYRIKLCEHCGLYYKSHVLSNDELASYYNEVDFSKWEIAGFFPSEEALLENCSQLAHNSRILDYGCSTGRLLSGLTNKHICFGVEVNKRAAGIAKSKGIKIINDDDINSNLQFDAIILCDVFEHLSHPTDTLRRLCHSLNRNGLLLMCTGNADAKACQKDMANYWYFRTPEHLSMLSRRYIDYISRDLNLELLVWKEVSHYKRSLLERIRQKTKSQLYWRFREHPLSLLSTVLGIVPFIQKAKSWNLPPTLDFTKDHVVVVLKTLT